MDFLSLVSRLAMLLAAVLAMVGLVPAQQAPQESIIGGTIGHCKGASEEQRQDEPTALMQNHMSVQRLWRSRGVVPTVAHSDHVAIPLVGLGTWPHALPLGMTNAQFIEALNTWISLGGRHIDAAWFYGNQFQVGKAVAGAVERSLVSRADLFITSKVPGTHFGYQQTKKQVLSETLPQLGLDYVDLLLLHWPCRMWHQPNCGGFDFLEERVSSWLALEELRAMGKARSIGVSNFEKVHLETLFDRVRNITGRDPNVTVNQIPWSPIHHDLDLFAWCRQRGISIESYASVSTYFDQKPIREIPEILEVAAAHNVSAFQAVFRWVVQRDIVLLTSTVTPSHMAQDLTPLFEFNLTEAEMAKLDGLNQPSAMLLDPAQIVTSQHF